MALFRVPVLRGNVIQGSYIFGTIAFIVMVRQGDDTRVDNIQGNEIRCYRLEPSQESFYLSSDV